MTREPIQTTENPIICTGRLVPVIESWDVGSGLETKQECNNILAIRHPVTTVDSWNTDDDNETKKNVIFSIYPQSILSQITL